MNGAQEQRESITWTCGRCNVQVTLFRGYQPYRLEGYPVCSRCWAKELARQLPAEKRQAIVNALQTGGVVAGIRAARAITDLGLRLCTDLVLALDER